MAYNFETMTPRELSVALNSPLGDVFAKRIATAAVSRLSNTDDRAYVEALERVVNAPPAHAEGTFGWALEALIFEGQSLTRAAWDGMDILYVPGKTLPVSIFGSASEGTVEIHPYIMSFHRDGSISEWVPTQSDILATDWNIVND